MANLPTFKKRAAPNAAMTPTPDSTAPSFSSARIGPTGYSATAANSVNVNPLDDASAMTNISRQCNRGGNRMPSHTARPIAARMPMGLPASVAASSAHVPVP